jgi:WD40 repeat protein
MRKIALFIVFLLIFNCGGGTNVKWNKISVRKAKKWYLHEAINDISISESGKYIAVATGSGKLHVIELPNGRPEALPFTMSTPLYAMVFQPSKDRVVYSGETGHIIYQEIGKEMPVRTMGIVGKPVVAMHVPRGQMRHILVGEADGHIRAWDLASGWEEWYMNAHTGSVRAIESYPKSSKAITLGDDGNLVMVDASSRKIVKSIYQPGFDVAVDDEGSTLAVGTNDGVVLYSLPDMVEYKTISTDGITIIAVHFIPGSKVLVGIGDKVYFWNCERGTSIRKLDISGDETLSTVACSPDGQIIAVGGTGGTIWMWTLL